MTDNDIIKALECCKRPANQTSCDDCPYQFSNEKCSSKLIDDAIALINRQKAEIEKYELVNKEKFNNWMRLEERTKERYAELYEEAKCVVRAEAIKEFAENLKGIDLYQCIEEYYKNAELCYEVIQDWFCEQIDNLVKEMTEGKE